MRRWLAKCVRPLAKLVNRVGRISASLGHRTRHVTRKPLFAPHARRSRTGFLPSPSPCYSTGHIRRVTGMRTRVTDGTEGRNPGAKAVPPVRAFHGDRCPGLQPARPGTAGVAAEATGVDCRSRPWTLFGALKNVCGRATLARVLFSASSEYARKRQSLQMQSTPTTTRPTRRLPRAGTTHGSEPRRSSPRLGSPSPRRAVARKVRAPFRASVPVRRCRP